MSDQSNIWNRQVDPALIQDANYRFDRNDRSYLDSQTRGLQRHLVQSLLGGLNASWLMLDPGSAAGSIGDVVALLGANMTRATTTAVGLAGGPYGILLAQVTPGQFAPVALTGSVPPSVTGLPTTGGNTLVRLNTTTCRCETVASLSPSDYAMGVVEANGYLSLRIQLPPASVGGGGGTSGQFNLTLANGRNDNLSTAGLLVGLIGGPTAAFSISGIASSASSKAGLPLVLINTTAFQMTILHESTNSSGANRIRCLAGNNGPLVVKPFGGSVTLYYDNITSSRWYAVSRGWELQTPLYEADVREFGAVGDGVTDDAAAINAAITFVKSTGGILYFPRGTYLINSTIVIDGSVGGGHSFHMVGVFGNTYPPGTLFTWGGPNGVPMVIIKSMAGFCMTDIALNGGGVPATGTGPSSCIQLKGAPGASTTLKFERCQASNPWSGAYWISGHNYTVLGTVVLGPDGNQFLSTLGGVGVITGNGHLYKLTSAGTSHAGGPASIWATTAGVSVNDGGAVWQEIGPVGSGIFLGDPYDPTGYEVSELVFEQCVSTGDGLATSGFRQVIGGNVKNIQFDHCQWESHGRGIDLYTSSGSINVTYNIFENSVETDIWHGGAGALTCTSLASEASTRLLVSLGSDCQDTIIGATWEGDPIPFPVGSSPNPFIISQNCTIIQGGAFFPIVSSVPAPGQIIQDRVQSPGGGGAGGFIDFGNVYELTPSFEIFDTGGNPLVPGAGPGGFSVPQTNLANPTRILSMGSQGTSASEGGPSVAFKEWHGQDVQFSLQQISQASSVGEVPNAHVLLKGSSIVGAVLRMTIGYQLLTAAAASQAFTIGCPFNKCLITNVVADVTRGFATIVTPTVTVGKVIGFASLNVNGAPTGGTTTANAYITSASIATATGATPIGKATGNQGASLTFPGDMVWGLNYGGTPATQWALLITFAAGTGNVNAATDGSVDIYVHFANYPGIT